MREMLVSWRMLGMIVALVMAYGDLGFAREGDDDREADERRIIARGPSYRRKENEAWRTRGRIVGAVRNAPTFSIEAQDARGRVVKSIRVREGEGLYELEWLRPGAYTLRVSAEGFVPLTVEEVPVKAWHDTHLHLDFAGPARRDDEEGEGRRGRDEEGERDHGEGRRDRDGGERDEGEGRRDREGGEREEGEGRRDGEGGEREEGEGRRDREGGEREEGEGRRDREGGEREEGEGRRDREGGEREEGEGRRDREGEGERREGEGRRDGERGDAGRAFESREHEGRAAGYVIGTVQVVRETDFGLKVRQVLSPSGRTARDSDRVAGETMRIYFPRDRRGRYAASGETIEKLNDFRRRQAPITVRVSSDAERHLIAGRIWPGAKVPPERREGEGAREREGERREEEGRRDGEGGEEARRER